MWLELVELSFGYLIYLVCFIFQPPAIEWAAESRQAGGGQEWMSGCQQCRRQGKDLKLSYGKRY